MALISTTSCNTVMKDDDVIPLEYNDNSLGGVEFNGREVLLILAIMYYSNFCRNRR